MARRKNLPELVRVKTVLSERLREIRTELYGERGGSEMARRLGLPLRIVDEPLLAWDVDQPGDLDFGRCR